MRGLGAGSIAVVALAGLALLAACGSSSPAARLSGLAARTISAGAVEVSLQPLRLDTSGAVFAVNLDTHSADLTVDIAAAARLAVDGTDWGAATWTGDPPGGHHRQGELRFRSGGPARGQVRMTISGLPGPVVATWSLASG